MGSECKERGSSDAGEKLNLKFQGWRESSELSGTSGYCAYLLTTHFHQQWVLVAIWLASDPVLISHCHIFLQSLLVPTILSLVPLKAQLEMKTCMQVIYLESNPREQEQAWSNWEQKSRESLKRYCAIEKKFKKNWPHCRWLMLEPVFVKISFMVTNSPEILDYICVSSVFPQMSYTAVWENPQKKWEHTV